MDRVAISLRFMQLFAHNAHNLTSGTTFFQDHEFYGELYPAYEAAYDSVVERIIGSGDPDLKGGKIDLVAFQRKAVDMLEKIEFSNTRGFSALLDAEKSLCKAVEEEVKGRSQGIVQLLGDIANASEMRQYKLKQRGA